MSKDLDFLIEEGEDLHKVLLTYVRDGVVLRQMSLDEINHWFSDVEKAAKRYSFSVPEKGDSLKLQFGWEGVAETFVARVLRPLRARRAKQEAENQNYDVAFSFAGEDRVFVKQLAEHLVTNSSKPPFGGRIAMTIFMKSTTSERIIA